MTAKKVESLRQKEHNNQVIRLFCTKPFLDNKWIRGIDRSVLKEFLVVSYTNIYDKWLPVWNIYDGQKVQWWDNNPHTELKTKIIGYSDFLSREEKDALKRKQASIEFNKADFEYYHTNNFLEAQNKYIEWCGNNVDKLGVGNSTGDD